MIRRLRWATWLLAGVAILAVLGYALRLRWTRGPLAPGPQRGDPVPEYAGVAFDGDTVALASLRGHVVLLNVWATWCQPCLAELPTLQALQRVYADSGLRIVAVSIDRDHGAARRFVRAHGLTWLNLLDDDDHVARTFATSPGASRTLLVDGSGTVQAFWYGVLDSARVQRIRDVLVAAGSSRVTGQLIRARSMDRASPLDTIPEIDPRAVSLATRAAALRTARQLGWADPQCMRFFVWGATAYVRLVAACPLPAGAEAERTRILAIAPNGLVTPADEVRYIQLCPAQRDSALRPLPFQGQPCLEVVVSPEGAPR